MRVQARVSRRARQVLSVSERDVLAVRRLVALGEAEVDDVNCVFSLVIASNQEIIRFDVSMDDSFLVHNLDSLDHLDGDVEAGLEVEFSSALLEVVFETLAEEVHDHDVVHLAILGLLVADEVEIGNRRLASQLVDQLRLPEKHNMLRVFHSLFNFSSEEITCLSLLYLIDFSEGTTSKFFNNFVALVKNLLSFFHT